jgi:hypothetical protein
VLEPCSQLGTHFSCEQCFNFFVFGGGGLYPQYVSLESHPLCVHAIFPCVTLLVLIVLGTDVYIVAHCNIIDN